MKVTFLIGNGFDLRMGMNTRYKDMYESYINVVSKDETIEKFKSFLRKDQPNDYTNWSDFEFAMGMHAGKFENESQFIKCVRDFRSHLVKYLESEEKRFIEFVSSHEQFEVACSNLISDGLSNFYRGQTPNVISRIRTIEEKDISKYDFITFNYTRVLDFMLTQYQKHTHHLLGESPIHIHGRLDGDVVLGVDNRTQFASFDYSVTKKMERAFIKPLFNAEFDVARVNRAKQIINKSEVICIYGMSLGITDKTWVDQLLSWLLENSNHHLIYFQYSEERFNNWNSDEKMDEEDERKDKLLNRLFETREEIEKVYDNVHIPVGYDIFDINRMLEENKARVLSSYRKIPVGL